ncbi:hypothetical protein ACFQH6_09375 [Halobacteriaceae archaeon GCM10025711]
MPFKERAPAAEYRVIDRWEDGVGWIAHPDETMQRASHAVAVDGDVWVFDPVDAPDLDDLLAELGDVKGVVVTMDRHSRDAAAVATRHHARVHLPSFVRVSVDAPVERVGAKLGDTDFRTVKVLNWPWWQEAAFFDGETLVVGDALGNASYFTAGDERLGVHPMLRLLPPAALRGLAPDRILVGHGTGVLEDATPALDAALRNARRGLPEAWLTGLREAFA